MSLFASEKEKKMSFDEYMASFDMNQIARKEAKWHIDLRNLNSGLAKLLFSKF